MLKRHIFKANRGEGKTKWLVERALDALDNDIEPIYVGSMTGYQIFCNVYEAIAHHKCNIPRIGFQEAVSAHLPQCLLTDELMLEYPGLPYINPQITGNWYITMSAEDFEA